MFVQGPRMDTILRPSDVVLKLFLELLLELLLWLLLELLLKLL